MTKPKLGKLGLSRRRESIPLKGGEMIATRPLRENQPLPLLVEPKGEGVDLVSWAASHQQRIRDWKQKYGGVLFRGFAMSVERFQAFIRAASGEPLEYKEQSSPRHQVAKNVYTSTDYPKDQPIFLHNENSYQSAWPLDLFFFCSVEPEAGGETPIADCRRIASRIPEEIFARFAERGIMYQRNFDGHYGLPWQRVFQTTDKAEVERQCEAKGLRFQWRDGDRLRTLAVRPLTFQHPVTGDKVWFNHATFFNVSTLPDVFGQALKEELDEEDYPTHTYYGDGSPIEPETLELLRQIYLEEKIVFPWRKNDILLLDNMLAAHGREPYDCERLVLVGMANPHALTPATPAQG